MTSDTSIVYAHVRTLVEDLPLTKPEAIVGYHPTAGRIILHYELAGRVPKKQTVEVILEPWLGEKFRDFYSRFCGMKVHAKNIQIPPGLPKKDWTFFRFHV